MKRQVFISEEIMNEYPWCSYLLYREWWTNLLLLAEQSERRWGVGVNQVIRLQRGDVVGFIPDLRRACCGKVFDANPNVHGEFDLFILKMRRFHYIESLGMPGCPGYVHLRICDYDSYFPGEGMPVDPDFFPPGLANSQIRGNFAFMMNNANKNLRLTAVLVSAGLAAATALADVSVTGPTDADGLLRAAYRLEDKNFIGARDAVTQTPADMAASRWVDAECAFRLRDPEARMLLENFLADYPASPQRQRARLMLADLTFDSGNYSAALAEYMALPEASFGTADRESLVYHRAYCRLMLGDYADALADFNSLSNSPQFDDAARFYRAYLAYVDKDYIEAERLFSAVTPKGDPGKAAPYFLMQIDFERADYAKALAEARNLLAANTVEAFRPECLRIAGESLYQLGDTSAALPYLWEYAAGVETPAKSTYYILGISEYDQGNSDATIKLLQQVVDVDGPVSQSAYLYLGQAYMKRGDYDSALMAFEQAYRRNYDRNVQETAFYNYAVARMDGGRVPFGSSVALFEDFLREFPDSRYAPDVQTYLIEGYMDANDYEHALAALDRIDRPTREMQLARQRALFVLATRDQASGDSRQAAKRLREVEKMGAGLDDSVLSQARLWLAEALYAQGEQADAEKAYTAYLKTAPDATNAFHARYGRGYANLTLRNFKAAKDDFAKALKALPADATPEMRGDVLNRLADSQYYLLDWSGALADYKRAYEANPASGDYALFQSAIVEGNRNDHRAKIEGLDRMMFEFPSSGLVPQALLEKAESMLALGRTADAIETYRTLIEDYPQTSQGRNGYLQLALTYQSAGRRNDAVEAYKAVVSDYPTSREAVLAVDDLKQIYAAENNITGLTDFLATVENAPPVDSDEIDELRRQGEERKLRDKAESEAKSGRWTAAWQTYSELEAAASTPEMLQEARMGLLRASTRLKRHADVVATADRLLATSADSPEGRDEVRLRKAEALTALKRHDEADELYKRLGANMASAEGAEATVAYGRSLLDRGKTDSAKAVIDSLIDANPPQPYWLARGFIVYSDILRAQGKTFEADEYLKSLKANYPGRDADIIQMINDRLK